MTVRRAAWWVVAPLAWVWQYAIYVPGHVIWNALNVYVGIGDPRALMVEKRPRLRPWFIERLRDS